MSITLAELRTQARNRADMESSEFVTDTELTDYINSSIAELHDILIQSYGVFRKRRFLHNFRKLYLIRIINSNNR